MGSHIAVCIPSGEMVHADFMLSVLHLVQLVRDEAHRFAVTFHRTKRNASRLESELAQIRGIGSKTVMKLLREFGSVERVRQASDGALESALGKALADKLRAALGPAEPAKL